MVRNLDAEINGGIQRHYGWEEFMELFLELIGRIIVYGILGCFVEGTYTAIRRCAMRRYAKNHLKGNFSLWMFPIYGIGISIGFDGLHVATQTFSGLIGVSEAAVVVRAPLYAPGIWLVEIIAGLFYRKILGLTVWNYSGEPDSCFGGLIRLKYAPFWIIFGLVSEPVRNFLDPIIRANL